MGSINISNSSTSSHPSNQQPSTYPLIETSYKQNVYSISPTDSHNRSCHDRLHDPQERRHSIIWQGPRLRRREMPGLRRRASWSTSTSSQRSGRLATIPSSTRSLPASKVQNNRQNGLGKGNGKRG